MTASVDLVSPEGTTRLGQYARPSPESLDYFASQPDLQHEYGDKL